MNLLLDERLKLTVLFIRLVRTVHVSVTDRAGADARAAVEAGLLPSGAVGERGAGSGVDGGEAPPAFARPTTGVGQAQVDTSAIVVGAAISAWRRRVKGD